MPDPTPGPEAPDLLERLRATEGHTAGPWWVSDGGNVWGGDIADDTDKIVARPSRDDAEAEASFALIALAPEMKVEIERLTATNVALLEKVRGLTAALDDHLGHPCEQIRHAEALAAAEEESFRIGHRDGFDEAVQHIDCLTGGDGEYRYCTDHDSDRHTPDSEAMTQRIVDRFAEAEAETLEQARLLGMGAERELALLSRAERAERERGAAVARAERAEAALGQIADGETHIVEGEVIRIPLLATLAQEIALAGLSELEKAAQARRCSCRGTDDYCPCQNVPDRQSRTEPALAAQEAPDA